MKKITSLFLLLFLINYLAPASAKAAPQCKNLFESIVVSDRTKSDGENIAAYFVSAIYDLTNGMDSIPFGKKIEGYSQSHNQAVARASSSLAKHDLNFAKLAQLDIVLKPESSEKLRKKIRIFIENEIASAHTLGSTDTNFKFFYKMVQLAQLPKDLADTYLKTFLEKKLRGNDLRRSEILIPLILEIAQNPNAEPFFKVVQDTETSIIIISSERDLKLSPYDDPTENIEDIGINFFQTSVNSKKDIREINYNGKSYTLELVQKRLKDKFGLFKRQIKPRLDEMWKDKELTGTILIDQEFTSDGNWLVDEYKEYYKQQGFEFARARKISVEEAFIKPFTSGSIDYLVTEHSGDITFSTNPQVLVGTRRTSKGLEKVQIIYTSAEELSEARSLMYTLDMDHELPRLIHIRNANKSNTELIFINGQCFSAGELRQLAERVDSSFFTYIAPSTIAETFSNSSASPLQVLITGIRQGLNYSEIKDQMKKSQKENNETNPDDTSTGENGFHLPNEPIDSRVGNSNFYNKVKTERSSYSAKMIDEKGQKRDVQFISLHGDL